MANVTLFGKTQTGKTTLAAYLLSYQMTDSEYKRSIKHFNNLYQKMERSKGNLSKTKGQITNGQTLKLEDRVAFNCFVSTDYDEIVRDLSKSSIGTTKRVHRKEIQITSEGFQFTDPFILLDTPGTHMRVYEKYEGMFEADSAICVMSATDIEKGISITDEDEKKSYFKEYFESLIFWGIYKGFDKVVIALTKSDQSNTDLISVFQRLLKTFTNEMISIVPTAVVFDNKSGGKPKGWNIEKREDFWKGPTLIEEIGRLCKITRKNEKDIESNGLAAVEGISQIKRESKYVLSCVVENGTFRTGDEVIVGPVKRLGLADHHLEKPEYLSGSISSMKREGAAELCNVLESGNIGGMSISGFKYRDSPRLGRSVDGYLMCKSAIISKKGTSILRGDTIKIEIRFDELSSIEQDWSQELLPFEQVHILWLDRMIPMSVIEKEQLSESILITVAITDQGTKESVREFVSLEPNEKNITNILMGIWIPEKQKRDGIYQTIRRLRYISGQVSWIYRLSSLREKQYRVGGDRDNLSILQMNKGRFVVQPDYATLRVTGKGTMSFQNSLRDARKYMKKNGIRIRTFGFER